MDRDLFCDPNENYQHFDEIILNAKTKHFAPKTVKFKKHKHKLSQWVTYGILNSIKYRDKIFLKSKATSNGTDLHKRLSENLKSYNKILKKTSSGQQKYNIMPSSLIRISQIAGTRGLPLRRYQINAKTKRFSSFLYIERQKYRW